MRGTSSSKCWKTFRTLEKVYGAVVLNIGGLKFSISPAVGLIGLQIVAQQTANTKVFMDLS
jgi:hypothetical protein